MIFKGKYKIVFRTQTEYEDTAAAAKKTARRMKGGYDENITIWRWDKSVGDGEYVPYA